MNRLAVLASRHEPEKVAEYDRVIRETKIPPKPKDYFDSAVWQRKHIIKRLYEEGLWKS